MDTVNYTPKDDYTIAYFNALGGPCELLIDSRDHIEVRQLTKIVVNEARRIEHKFSRYRKDNIIHSINHSCGQAVKVDDESADLFDYAQHCYHLSGGLFDITSGVLRTIWNFSGKGGVPERAQVERQLERIGWHRVRWNRPFIQLQKNMEVDLGGIGKEYAVDRCVQLLQKSTNTSCLVNLGGDMGTNSQRSGNRGWVVGIEQVDTETTSSSALPSVEIRQGAIATSGDTKRYILEDGIRYGHILNPKSGYPVTTAPRSITVLSESCTEAGIMATLAMLHEEQAEEFLEVQGVKYWSVR